MKAPVTEIILSLPSVATNIFYFVACKQNDPNGHKIWKPKLLVPPIVTVSEISTIKCP